MSNFRRQLLMSYAVEPTPPPPPPPYYLGYVTDGLVAMWDGLHNKTLDGEHDGSVTKWTDIVGGVESAVMTNQTWGDNYIQMTDANLQLFTSGAGTLLPDRPYTVEMVAEEITKSESSNAAGGLIVRARHRVGFFRHLNNNAWGPACFMASNYYVAMKIAGLTYSQIYPKASKSFIVKNWSTISSSTARNCVNVYYNGTLLTEHLYTYSSGNPPTESDVITLARSTAGTYRYYNIRIYNRALSADEIAANYALDVERFNI